MNRRLSGGLILLAALCALALSAERLAPFPAGSSETIRLEIRDGVEVTIYAPEPPNARHPLGTDGYGFDIASEMLFGLRWTLGAVFGAAVARCTLAVILGAALGSVGAGPRRRKGLAPIAALPGFVLAAFLLVPVTINPVFPPFLLFCYQVAVLSLIDLPALSAGFAAKTRGLSRLSFVEAARASGADEAWIVRVHYAPFLLTDFLEALPVQALAIGSLIGKLGVVSLFIGGTTLTLDPRILRSSSGEWLGLLGHYRNAIYASPWLFLAPLAGWMLVFACAGLLASGLRHSFEKNRRIGSIA